MGKLARQQVMPGTGGVSVYSTFKAFKKQFRWQQMLERAAAIAYNTIMALPPSLLFLFTLIPILPFIPKNSMKLQMHELIYDIIPAKVHNKDIIDFVDNLIDKTTIGLISFSFLSTLFFASNAIMGIMRSFDRDQEGFKKRKGLAKRWVALKLTGLNFTLIISYIFLLIFQGNLLDLLVESETWKSIISYSRWLFIIALVFFSIAFLFRYAPSIHKRWNLFSPGAVLSTTLSLTSSLLFAMFVNNFGRYNALYGTLGTLMMVMALIFINSLSLLIGFELNICVYKLKRSADDTTALMQQPEQLQKN